MIDPKDVIAQYSVEELNRTAEEYFEQITDPTNLFTKPFSNIAEAPALLESVGLLLSGVRLGHGMTVLEFAAGSCWLSKYISQLRCKTISVDVSQTALNYGKQLFDEYPSPGKQVAEPEFVLFDGFKLDLPDESVDRIVCNDGFHHVPNQEQVLAEFCRVLRPGGIAGFSEPGRNHSKTPVSQHDMQHFKVLENDILLDEIFEKAKRGGFTDIRIKPIGNIEVGMRGYNLLTSRPLLGLLGAVSKNTAQQLTSRSIFFLYKGSHVPDSREADGLSHSIQLKDPNQSNLKLSVGEKAEIGLNVVNSGTSIWLTDNIDNIGVVQIGTHLKGLNDDSFQNGWSWHPLEAETGPGGRIDQTIELSFDRPGEYQLIIDLVSTHVAWFEHLGSVPITISVSVQGA